MTLQTRKSDLKTQVNRYITLLSNLAAPDHEFIQSLEYFKGLVDFANQKEISGLESRFLAIKPSDSRSVRYIDTGRLDDAPGLVQTSDIIKVMTLRGGPTSGNWGHKGRPGKHGGSISGGGHATIGISNRALAAVKKLPPGKARELLKKESKKLKERRGEIGPDVDPAKVKAARATLNSAMAERNKKIKAYHADKDVKKEKELGKKEEKLRKDLDKNWAKQDKIKKGNQNIAQLPTKDRDAVLSLIEENNQTMTVLNGISEQRMAIGQKIQRRREAGDLVRPDDADARYFDATDEAHEVLFAHNQNEAKKIRVEMRQGAILARHANKVDSVNAQREKVDKELNDIFNTLDDVPNTPEAEAAFQEKWTKKSKEAKAINAEADRLHNEGLELYKPILTEGVSPTKIKRIDTGEKPQDYAARQWDEGEQAFNSLVDRNTLLPGTTVEFNGIPNTRANAPGPSINLDSVNGDARTTVHELGHVLEYRNERVARKAQEFLNKRTDGLTEEKLSDLTGHAGYRDNETAVKDDFINPYMGKKYRRASGEYYATEIMSMGLELMYLNPMSLAGKDPEMFDLVYALSRSG